jgi:hypothetical protein
MPADPTATNIFSCGDQTILRQLAASSIEECADHVAGVEAAKVADGVPTTMPIISANITILDNLNCLIFCSNFILPILNMHSLFL